MGKRIPKEEALDRIYIIKALKKNITKNGFDILGGGLNLPISLIGLRVKIVEVKNDRNNTQDGEVQ